MSGIKLLPVRRIDFFGHTQSSILQAVAPRAFGFPWWLVVDAMELYSLPEAELQKLLIHASAEGR